MKACVCVNICAEKNETGVVFVASNHAAGFCLRCRSVVVVVVVVELPPFLFFCISLLPSCRQVLSLLGRMKSGGVRRTLLTFNSALLACAKVCIVGQPAVSYGTIMPYHSMPFRLTAVGCTPTGRKSCGCCMVAG